MSLEKSIFNFRNKLTKALAVATLSSILSSCPMEEPPKNTNSFEYKTSVEVVKTQEIDSETGGEIKIDDANNFLYGTELEIPPGSLSDDTTISVGLVNNPPPLPSGMNYVGAVIDIKANEKNLNAPITISIPYNDEWIHDAGLDNDSQLKVCSYAPNKAISGWFETPFSLDAINKIINVTLSHFGYYSITCLMDNPPEELGSPKPGDLLYTLGAVWAEGDPLFRSNWMPGHVGIYVGEKDYTDNRKASDDVKKFKKYNVIEALLNGVQLSYYQIPNNRPETFKDSLKFFNGGNVYMGAREAMWSAMPDQYNQRIQIVDFAEKQVGKPYAMGEMIGSIFGLLPGYAVKGPEKFNCVGLAEKAYEIAGVNNGEGLVTPPNEDYLLTPAEQYRVTQSAVSSMLRMRGPAGGWIFYDKGDYNGGWRYLEVAPDDQTSSIWGTYDLPIDGADGIEIGTGRQNTLDILARDPSTNKAAEKCADYVIINNSIIYDDWFLPSLRELNQIGINLCQWGIGNFVNSAYWSSSEYERPWSAWCAYPAGIICTNDSKDAIKKVRAIRFF